MPRCGNSPSLLGISARDCSMYFASCHLVTWELSRDIRREFVRTYRNLLDTLEVAALPKSLA
jgi:hypothetical protein